ncbi:hypothetical protein NPIL_444211 [Nephila pilipes]|uniref:Uncharacterized protein n=1 Tax=Nephila pilipes TaxID=299642 RepID=A0A8X6TY78_NEPPI|nr:hypothetical protein NPIL_444211 [Nephila pilipes]
MNLTIWALLCGWVALCAAVGVPKNERGKVLRTQHFLEIFSGFFFTCRDQDLPPFDPAVIEPLVPPPQGRSLDEIEAWRKKGYGMKSFGSRRLQGSSVV